MKKLFINILIVLGIFLSCASWATTLKGGVEKIWTVDSAREEAFRTAKPWLDLSQYPSMDSNFNENKNLIQQNQFDSKDRHITVFSDGWYAVRYYNTMTESYYYNSEGELKEIEFTIYAKNVYTMEDINKYSVDELFPSKDYQHQYPSGKINSIRISPKYMEDYGFKPNGELTDHCIGNNCYDANNKLIMTRKSE